MSEQALKKTDPSDPMARLYSELLSQIKGFQKDSNGYGLLHGDFHHGNFHYDRTAKKITLFDFDDSNYFWYAFDLAIPFASLELSKRSGGFDLDYVELQDQFMSSYLEEYDLAPFWLDKIDVFMKYRFASLYFWSKGRVASNRVRSAKDTKNFMKVCERLVLKR